MEFKQLIYFVTVVDEGTISAASKKLHMTQPPLSTQLKLLEYEIGCCLFERGARSIRLTEAGRILYDRAVSLIHMASLIQEELQEYQNGSHGTLRLGIVSSVNSPLFCQWFHGFHKAHPNIHFEISEANTYQLLEKLQNGLIELAIVRTPFPVGDFFCTPLKKECIVAAGHKDFFKESKGEIISLEELSQMPLILYRRWESILSEAFRASDLELNPLCKNDDARTTAFWTDAGLGVGILPESAIPLFRNEDIIWKTIDDERMTSSISVIRSKSAHLSPIAKSFMDDLIASYTS